MDEPGRREEGGNVSRCFVPTLILVGSVLAMMRRRGSKILLGGGRGPREGPWASFSEDQLLPKDSATSRHSSQSTACNTFSYSKMLPNLPVARFSYDAKLP